MIVLKIIGFVLLGILALVLIALCVRVRIFAEYSEHDTNVRVHWFFVKIPLYPGKGKKTKNNTADNEAESTKNEAGAEASVLQTDIASTIDDSTQAETAATNDDGAGAADSAEEATEQKPKNNLLKTIFDAHGIDGLLLIVRRIFRYLGTFTGNLMTSAVIDELYLDVRCTRPDAASTAIYYGEVCSSLFPMLGALVSKYKIRKYDINVYPDFLAKTSSASFAVSLHLYPIYLICISIALAIKMLFKVLLRLIVKCFLPSKNKNEENKNTVGSDESAA